LRTQVALENEQADLEGRINKSQIELATNPYNESLRIQAALLEDIVQFRHRDEEAIIAQNRAQIELADQTVFHAEQARAAVLEQFSRDKSVTQIWAEGFMGAADALTNTLSSAFDVITRKLGVFGNLIKTVLTDLSRLVINRVFMRLLDSVLPAGGSGGAGGAGGGGGGGKGILGSIGSFLSVEVAVAAVVLAQSERQRPVLHLCCAAVASIIYKA
jgi:hypothetical protein